MVWLPGLSNINLSNPLNNRGKWVLLLPPVWNEGSETGADYLVQDYRVHVLSEVKHSLTFHSALREEFGKKYTHQDKGSHEHYLGFECRGWRFILEKWWCVMHVEMTEMTQRLYLIFLSVFLFWSSVPFTGYSVVNLLGLPLSLGPKVQQQEAKGSERTIVLNLILCVKQLEERAPSPHPKGHRRAHALSFPDLDFGLVSYAVLVLL